MIPSCVEIWRIYAKAERHVGRVGKNVCLASHQSHLRRVSVEFHKRLKRAGIHVEGA